MEKIYTFNDFIPLFGVLGLVAMLTLITQVIRYPRWCGLMSDFMGFFFIIFGFFKIINLKGFVKAYQQYDLVAQKSVIYAYIYPFLELSLGLAYVLRIMPVVVNSITLVLMLVSAAGVMYGLLHGQRFTCACLGAIFKVPMTWVTLIEDLVMAAMAAAMLLLPYWGLCI